MAGFPALQYEIALAAMGMDDNVDHPWSPHQKLTRLRQYEKAWADIFPTKLVKNVVPLSDDAGWEWYGGVLWTTLGDHSVQFYRPGSRIRSTPLKAWVLKFTLSPSTLHMNPYQDLVVLTFLEEQRYAPVSYL